MPNFEGPPGPPKKPPPREFELSPEEEKRVIEQIIEKHESVVGTARRWAEVRHGGRPIPAEKVVEFATLESRLWFDFVRDLLGITTEQTFDVLKERGYYDDVSNDEKEDE